MAPAADYIARAIFFATDRNVVDGRADTAFGAERSGLIYGSCVVTLPRDHRLGELESPRWYRLEFSPDPEKHVTLREIAVESREIVLARIARDARDDGAGSVFLFVHGFDVSFEDAARRTGQIAYDIGFNGPSGFFSWPSKATLSPLAYAQDAQTAEWAAPHLASVLERVAAEDDVKAIYVLAHSMGGRVLTYALAQTDAMAEKLKGKLREVILAAPDIDAQVFVEQIAPKLANLGSKTIYASSGDVALKASKTFNGFPRLGDSGPGLVVLRNMDTIDASATDTDLIGHSYYGNGGMLGDLRSLLVEGKRPPRPNLTTRDRNGLPYWELARPVQ